MKHSTWLWASLILSGSVFAQESTDPEVGETAPGAVAETPSETEAETASPAEAEPVAATDDGAIEEIVVTAQRREQSVQDVPISVTAVGEALINSGGLIQIQDVSMLAPSLVPGSQVGYGQPYIRGVGSNIVTVGTESSVALYVDGIYQSRNLALMSNLGNVQRIEVLSGPQGALYGRNATGGVINIVTKRPKAGFSGQLESGLGNVDLFQSKGYFAGGSETLAGSGAFYTRRHGGYDKNLANGEDVNSQDDYGVAGKLVYTPTELDEITLAFDRGETGPDAGAYQNQLGTNNVTVGVVPGAQFSSKPHEVYSNENGDRMYNETRTTAGNARWRHSFEAFDFTTIGSYRTISARSSTDVDASDVPFIYFSEPKERTRDYSLEANVVSTGSGPLSWLGGVNYFRTDGYSYNFIEVSNLAFQRVITTADLQTDAIAAFGQVDYRLNEKWKLSGGLRYTHEKKQIEGVQEVYLGEGYPLAATIPQPGDEKTWNNVAVSSVIGYDFNEDANAYFRFATGFKSGAYNAVQPTDPALDPEKIKSYEIGVKTDWFERVLRVNAAAFYYDYKDLQVGQITDAGGILYVNAAAAKIYGAEADATWRVTQKLTVTLSGALLQSEYQDFPSGASLTLLPGTVGGAPGNYPAAALGLPEPSPNGNDLTRAPKFSGSLSLSYWQPSSIGDWEFVGAARYTDSYFFDIGNALEQDGYTLVNASLTYHSPEDQFFVRSWANNLTDEDYLNFASRTNAGDFGNYAAPRTYGVTVGVNF